MTTFFALACSLPRATSRTFVTARFVWPLSYYKLAFQNHNPRRLVNRSLSPTARLRVRLLHVHTSCPPPPRLCRCVRFVDRYIVRLRALCILPIPLLRLILYIHSAVLSTPCLSCTLTVVPPLELIDHIFSRRPPECSCDQRPYVGYARLPARPRRMTRFRRYRGALQPAHRGVWCCRSAHLQA
ncbi:hypothetical protein BV20DRAFT_590801 [Pilatotrama ljubarskyi]|nr:hypothetical protein BV20DRAFT_590801 [Pilatotrama ljubarskyi]